MGVVNVFTYWRFRQLTPVSEWEFFTQLLFDCFSLTLLLYISGGASNPFVSYYLIPIIIAAATLALPFTIAITLICLSCYTLLLFFYQPLPQLIPLFDNSTQQFHMINLHVVGMWLNFSLSALLICGFVVRMAQTLRQHQAQLAKKREQDLRNEQLFAVGSLAAGAAHELNTPLNTMLLLVNEMKQDYQQHPALSDDLSCLTNQLNQCKQSLNTLITEAQVSYCPTRQSINKIINQLLERWQVIRPEILLELDTTRLADSQVLTDASLPQALLNLLNNAADQSQHKIEFFAETTSQHIKIIIRDFGPGLDMANLEKLGTPFYTNRPDKGLGLGLTLSQASIERLGGSVTLLNHIEQGTETHIRLPLAKN
ncbi:ATP-binding protein [Spartinivicinus ruber]|uniref:ATP-binding protein n=1 Tax=Spartinivicinus ruber TaxID=2683272 RepID=UPI0013D7925C|nr:ATP-binding protein [Spartinivicinus ruber]